MARVYYDRIVETSVSTGTGPFSVIGANPGYRAFASVVAVGDTFDYAIYAVDGNGIPTGAWETGRGTYTAANQITRTTVFESSNGNAAVAFPAGTKYIMLSENAQSFREIAAAVAAAGGGGVPWYYNPPLASSFALSQYNSSGLLQLTDTSVGLTIDCPQGFNGSAIQTALGLQNLPTGDWTATMRMEAGMDPREYIGTGMWLKTPSGKAYSFGTRVYTSVINMMVNAWTNPTTFSADSFTMAQNGYEKFPWRRITFNATTGVLTFLVSIGGKKWMTVYTANVTGFFGGAVPDQIGIFVGSTITTGFLQANIDHWSVV